MIRALLALLFGFTSTLAAETVVCVHGFMRSAQSMALMANALRKEGHLVMNWSYPSRGESIESHAAALVEKLQELVQERPGEPICFVTHSLGGVIVRAALNHPDCPIEAKVGRAVLLAPPDRGAQLARTLYKRPLARILMGDGAGRDLGTTEEGGFDALGPFPESMGVLVIAGTRDGKVLIEETHLTSPHERLEGPYYHTWIAWHPRVITATKEFIGRSSLGRETVSSSHQETTHDEQ